MTTAPAPKTAAAPVDPSAGAASRRRSGRNTAPETIATAPAVPVDQGHCRCTEPAACRRRRSRPPLPPRPHRATPLGVWATEENKGTVRIEQCGENLCGVAAKSGEKILINMKPSDVEMDRTDSRSRQRQDLRLQHDHEGAEHPAGSGLRLRRNVLRRPDLDAGQLARVLTRLVASSHRAQIADVTRPTLISLAM